MNSHRCEPINLIRGFLLRSNSRLRISRRRNLREKEKGGKLQTALSRRVSCIFVRDDDKFSRPRYTPSETIYIRLGLNVRGAFLILSCPLPYLPSLPSSLMKTHWKLHKVLNRVVAIPAIGAFQPIGAATGRSRFVRAELKSSGIIGRTRGSRKKRNFHLSRKRRKLWPSTRGKGSSATIARLARRQGGGDVIVVVVGFFDLTDRRIARACAHVVRTHVLEARARGAVFRPSTPLTSAPSAQIGTRHRDRRSPIGTHTLTLARSLARTESHRRSRGPIFRDYRIIRDFKSVS